jgi:hypothetical protein
MKLDAGGLQNPRGMNDLVFGNQGNPGYENKQNANFNEVHNMKNLTVQDIDSGPQPSSLLKYITNITPGFDKNGGHQKQNHSGQHNGQANQGQGQKPGGLELDLMTRGMMMDPLYSMDPTKKPNGLMDSFGGGDPFLLGTHMDMFHKLKEKNKYERSLKIERYKNKKRNWAKKISYDCRKRVADTRLRIKGRFISKKVK